MEQENKSSVGSIIGTIIILVIIILGGLYFWGKRVEENKNAQSMTTNTTTPYDSEANAIQSATARDDLGSIDADLKATNTANLGTEANTSAN